MDPQQTNAAGPRSATEPTREHQASSASSLPWTDQRDFDNAQRGFIASLPDVEITNARGRVVWTLRLTMRFYQPNKRPIPCIRACGVKRV